MCGYYKDLREWMDVLEASDKLWRIKSQVTRESELTPMVRWQYRGLQEGMRKAFVFENIVNVNGTRYAGRVAASMLGASKEIFALGLKCEPSEINSILTDGLRNRIEPKILTTGATKEEVHQGENIIEHGGVEEFPIPISCPGYEPAPYISCGSWVTKDPDTGVRNVGVYRGMLKAKNKIGVEFSTYQDIAVHLRKSRELGVDLEAACFIGMIPNVEMSATTKVPYGVDEFEVAGGISGEPVELVKCETVDLEVPAHAEIVLEGKITSNYLEPEGPYSEYPGYMSAREEAPIFNINCITHRKQPIVRDFTNCGMPPCEASKIRQITYSAHLYNFLRHSCGITGVLQVALNEMGGPWVFCVIQMKKFDKDQPWRALNALVSTPTSGKIAIVVDDDINPEDMSSVIWALCWRVQPHRDIRVTPGKSVGNDPSRSPPGTGEDESGSALLIDATRKWPYPPIALPPKEFMENAARIWKAEGLPELEPREPWYGKMLGFWPEEFQLEAQMALKGEHMKTAEKHATLGRKLTKNE